MTITFYKTTSEPNRVDKSLTSLGNTEIIVGYGGKDLDKINPFVRVKVETADFDKNCNYAYIDEFSRYYFVESVTIVDGGLFELRLHVDVLYTYKTAIGTSDALVVRSGNTNNKYIVDALKPIGNKSTIQLYEFAQGFNRSTDTVIVTYGQGGTKVL